MDMGWEFGVIMQVVVEYEAAKYPNIKPAAATDTPSRLPLATERPRSLPLHRSLVDNP